MLVITFIPFLTDTHTLTQMFISTDDLTSGLLTTVVKPVSAGLHHVDLPGGGEAPVDVGDRHQPERRPDPGVNI